MKQNALYFEYGFGNTFIMNEWKPLVYKNVELGSYWISEYGDLYNTKTGNFLNQSTDKDGYKYITIINKYDRFINLRIHRAVMNTFKGPIDNFENLQVNHINEYPTNPWFLGLNKAYNHYSNLETVTALENQQHATAHGYRDSTHGANCNFATITNEQVHEIARLLIENKTPLIEIGPKVGTSTKIIHDIFQGKTWQYELSDIEKESIRNITCIPYRRNNRLLYRKIK